MRKYAYDFDIWVSKTKEVNVRDDVESLTACNKSPCKDE